MIVWCFLGKLKPYGLLDSQWKRSRHDELESTRCPTPILVCLVAAVSMSELAVEVSPNVVSYCPSNGTGKRGRGNGKGRVWTLTLATYL